MENYVIVNWINYVSSKGLSVGIEF